VAEAPSSRKTFVNTWSFPPYNRQRRRRHHSRQCSKKLHLSEWGVLPRLRKRRCCRRLSPVYGRSLLHLLCQSSTYPGLRLHRICIDELYMHKDNDLWIQRLRPSISHRQCEWRWHSIRHPFDNRTTCPPVEPSSPQFRWMLQCAQCNLCTVA